MVTSITVLVFCALSCLFVATIYACYRSYQRFELIEEEVAQHRLGAHPLRLSVTVEDPAEGETCKASREQGLMRCETHLRYPIKPFKIRYKSGKTETYGANYPSINRLMFAVENLLHDFMPLRSEIDAK